MSIGFSGRFRGKAPAVWGFCLFVTCLAPAGAALAESITVVSWGGSYARACQQAYHESFTDETGIEILLEDYNGGLAQVRAQVDAGAVHWDVVDMEMPDGWLACQEGLIELVEVTELPDGVNGEAPEDDYPSEYVTECGSGVTFYSTVVAYNSNYMTGPPPQTIADFFDLEKYPGRRGMRRSPFVNLEFALLADGVAPDGIYSVLATSEGLDRAFAKLDTIKDQVVWWEAGAQPPQLLADGEVIMSTAYNGRIFNAQVLENQPFVIVWDGQALDSGFLAIVAGTPRFEAARQFVLFANRPESIANISKYISYGPVRQSPRALVDRHLATGVEMQPHMPTSPANMKRAVRLDWRWWSENRDDVYERFSAWLAR
ncbi:MAG: ABC transporter substrate-binding protein [Gammaproteobacteria bacterium]|nr:ABC transporter substrate-binding protein [Gammaproteobacteria bacterium]